MSSSQDKDKENQKKFTHFGFTEVPVEEKTNLVKSVFQNVANKYDVMNDFMSLGLHRFWKQQTIRAADVRPGQIILDLASGTCDLAIALAKRVGEQGKVIASDINGKMLERGRERVLNAGLIERITFAEANAEQLPFKSNTFDCITIAFGLRNVTNQLAALQAMYRVLKPGGKLLVLEFSAVNNAFLDRLYEFYSFNVIPKLGEWIAKDKASYQYLVESIRRHPNQQDLKALMEKASLEDVRYSNFLDGIVALHIGYKY